MRDFLYLLHSTIYYMPVFVINAQSFQLYVMMEVVQVEKVLL